MAGERILVVEDDPQALYLMTEILTTAEYVVLQETGKVRVQPGVGYCTPSSHTLGTVRRHGKFLIRSRYI